MAFSLRTLLRRGGPVVPVVRLAGPIGIGGGGFRQTLSIASVAPLLARAFAMKSAPAVAISINSPGGSAVQSHLIHRRIRALAEEKNKPVIVAVEDAAASGGYMIAVAGDEIVVDPSSIVGSIGVIYSGFGFEKAIARIGIERRVHTAGENKAILDPFAPEKAADVARLKALQADIHDTFIDLVKGRRTKLADDPELFTGAFWTGDQAVKLGLADRTGELRAVLREKFGEKVVLKVIAQQPSLLRRRLGLGPAASMAAGIESALGLIEERLLWERYGL
ncbi:S49 family peptidase [Bauldia sp.]|uniref:S49 family peptidase n=1 Tax=Bauldia sp. TaxID=2575872 RepID=UPI003BA84580